MEKDQENPFPFVPDAPIYGNFFELLELNNRQEARPTAPVVNYQGGYYWPKLGRFFPYPP